MTVGHACIVKALELLNKRAESAGLEPGLNEGDDTAPLVNSAVLAGTDLAAAELNDVARVTAEDFVAGTLLPILERQEGIGDGEDERASYLEVIEAIGSYWVHGAVTGAIAVRECIR